MVHPSVCLSIVVLAIVRSINAASTSCLLSDQLMPVIRIPLVACAVSIG